EHLTSSPDMVPQEKLGFGQPPVTLYRARDFYISALYWLEGTTDIHEHGFSGAFRVLEGSSIHAVYDFSRPATITPRLAYGHLLLSEAELLRKGATRRIQLGGEFIHSLFHLDSPSVTIVVRTGREGLRQNSYCRPGVAFDPLFDDPALQRRMLALETMRAFA